MANKEEFMANGTPDRVDPARPGLPMRRKLPDERMSITHKFSIAGHEGYLTVGEYEDGTPGEIFLTMAKEGSTISGFADAFAQAISYALQYGVPLQVLVDKFSHSRFEPSGMTKNPEIRFAKSIVDYIFRWMGNRYLAASESPLREVPKDDPNAPPCSTCGTVTQRLGALFKCPNCGTCTEPER